MLRARYFPPSSTPNLFIPSFTTYYPSCRQFLCGDLFVPVVHSMHGPFHISRAPCNHANKLWQRTSVQCCAGLRESQRIQTCRLYFHPPMTMIFLPNKHGMDHLEILVHLFMIDALWSINAQYLLYITFINSHFFFYRLLLHGAG